MEELIYPALLRPRLAATWEQAALVDEEGVRTFGDNAESAWTMAWALRSLYPDVTERRFAVLAHNSSAYFDLWQAAAWGGGVLSPVDPRLSYPELTYVLRDSAPQMVFVDAAHAELVARLRSDGWQCQVVGLGEEVDGADLGLKEFASNGRTEPPPDPEQDDPVLLMYTGGTSGRPKAVLHNQRGLCLALHRTHALTRVAEPDARFYQTSPLFHIMATAGTLAAPAGGAFVVLRKSFDIAQMLSDITTHRLTHVAMVPTMFTMLLEHPDFNPERLTSLRYVIYGGSAVPAPVLRRLLDVLPRVEFVQSYGMTEAFGGLTGLSGEDHRQQRGLDSVGRPLLGVEIQVQDGDGAALPAGRVGELCARCGSIMSEYRGDPERTEQALRGGWYHTGDLGTLDEQGYVRITDRKDDMIVSGGENVYSSEVEAALMAHPAVLQVAVIGVPDPKWGQRVHAVVVVRPAEEAGEKHFKAFLRQAIAGYKVPKTFDIQTEPLPLSGAGKVQKHVLRAVAP